MDETNQQQSEKDLDLIVKDCDGNGSVRETSSISENLYAEDVNEVENFDNKAVMESSSANSNGIISDPAAMDGQAISDITTTYPESGASTSELMRSDSNQNNSEQNETCDNVDFKIQTTVNYLPDSDDTSFGKKAENIEQNQVSGLWEQRDDNNFAVDVIKCDAKNLPVEDQKESNINAGTCGVNNRDLNVQINYESSSDNSLLEKQIESSKSFESMPYGEKEVSVNVEMNSESENTDHQIENVTNDIKINSITTTLCQSEMSSNEIKSPCDGEVIKDCRNENENEADVVINDSSKIVPPLDVDVDNIEFNQLVKENLENVEDILQSKNSYYNERETDQNAKNNDESQEIEPTQDGDSTVSSSNTSQSNEPELLKNNSPNEKNETLRTELVNCNDESQMELCEHDKDTEVNNIDMDPCEDADKKQYEDYEEMEVDRNVDNENLVKETEKKEENHGIKYQFFTENEKQIIAVDESEALIQPEDSEEETITGDTSHEGPINDSRGKDAEVCIIPDDGNLRLPALADKEKLEGKDTEKDGIKILSVTSLEIEKDEEGGYEKNDDDSSGKARPVRVAAKVAENKIKSLVQSDFPSESSSPNSGQANEEEKSEKSTNTCAQCGRVKTCKLEVMQDGRSNPLCSDQCYNAFSKGVHQEVLDVDSGINTRKCSQCHQPITVDENTLSWETMDFCNEECLGKYQTVLGSNCANCKGNVASASLGKYCVRFGYDVKQFCTASCLEEYKKGLKVCSYCQKDISKGTEGFLAPVGDKGHFKDFCTQSCMEKYEQMSNNILPPNVVAECAVCSNSKQVKVEVELDNKTQKLCSEPCFAAFKFVNNITEGQCDMCKKYFDKLKTDHFSIFYENSPHTFCGKTCMNVYILANRKIIPCNWCKVKKYNFDMIKKGTVAGQILMMCSLNCLALYQVSVNSVTSRRIKCDFCLAFAQPKYHLTMSDATVRNFCGYMCVMSFQNRYPKQALSLPAAECVTSPIPTGGPKKILPKRSQVNTSVVPVISSVQSLASPNGPVGTTRVSIPTNEMSIAKVASITQPIAIQPTVPTMPTPPPPQVYQQIITKPAPVKQQKNKSVLCKPYSHTKGVSCRPHPCMKETQTDESLNRKFLIPVPVPIYVPAPMHMFATPFPVAVPFPLPVPVPIFIPTTRNSAKGIFKEIKKIQEKIPTDPFEAELLMMAEMVAGEKKQDPTDSESDEGNEGDDGGDGTFSPENVDTSNTFGEDMLQMALKMATELEEPAVDMESVLTSNTITPTSQPNVDPNKGLYGVDPDDPDQVQVMPMTRGRKRPMRGGRNSSGGTQSKRGRRISGSNVDVPMLAPPEPVPPQRIEVEKPDANMCLKYTFGVNAWRHWVMQKNAELEKVALTNRKIKLFKPDILQLTADELNFSLCLFVKEVRKPNGTEYAPDTIYYLCLGIQQYLFENGRIDNIFTDSYYEKFTDCLDEVAKKFAALYSDSQYIVTRVEEEHLWESKQLGAHSPHVLLSTLMFFNTKHFNLVTVEEHMQLSFSHIMKHWKRNPNAPGVAKVPGSRNVLLRFYPPQSALEANSRKKKVYEQQENEENPLRCPVKLYEFYLSKCPESVKTRNDVFYLLPERSCVPDSPVWYSTMALGKEPLTKMLHRVKMVKEINIALLTC